MHVHSVSKFCLLADRAEISVHRRSFVFSYMTMFNLLPSFREDSAFPWTQKLHSSTPEAICSVINILGSFSVRDNCEIPFRIQSTVFCW